MDKRIKPSDSDGSRKRSIRKTGRLVSETRERSPRVVSKRTGLGPSPDEKRRETEAVSFLLWVAVLFFLSLSVIFLWFQGWAFVKGDKAESVVPEVVGMTYEQAGTLVDEAKLVLRIRSESFSDDVEADIITEQLPASGARVKAGREVLVDISKGSRTLVTPNVVGMSKEEAEQQLEAIGVKHRFVNFQYSDLAPVGTILNQIPAPGAPIAIGEEVELVTSAGILETAVEMPALEGLPYEEALQVVQSQNLSLQRVSWSYLPGITETVISSQYPMSGTRLKEGTEILLTVQAPVKLENLGKRDTRVVINVPESEGTVLVQITVQDRNETKEVYSKEHTGPSTIEQLVSSYGRTTIRVNFNGRNVREETF